MTPLPTSRGTADAPVLSSYVTLLPPPPPPTTTTTSLTTTVNTRSPYHRDRYVRRSGLAAPPSDSKLSLRCIVEHRYRQERTSSAEEEEGEEDAGKHRSSSREGLRPGGRYSARQYQECDTGSDGRSSWGRSAVEHDSSHIHESTPRSESDYAQRRVSRDASPPPSSSSSPLPPPRSSPQNQRSEAVTGRHRHRRVMTPEERRRARSCIVDGCNNYIVHRRLCFRHGVSARYHVQVQPFERHSFTFDFRFPGRETMLRRWLHDQRQAARVVLAAR